MSVEKRPAHTRNPWVARVRRPDGKEMSRSFPRRVEAVQWEEEQRTAIRRGDWVDPYRGRIVWADYVDEVLSARTVQPRTMETYRLAAKRVDGQLGELPLNKITPELLKRVVADLAREYSPETVRKSVRLVRMVFDEAVENQRLVRSPASTLRGPTIPKREMRLLSAGEIAVLAGALPDRYQLIPYMAGFLGLRFGEIAGLKRSAVDMKNRKVRIREVLKEPAGGGPPVLGRPKSEAGVRDVSMQPEVKAMLAEHLLAFPPVDGFVFTTEAGSVLRRGSFSRVWRRAVDESVGQPCRLHDLRHSHVKLLIEQGKHAKVIQNRLGHGSITVTMDRYGHLMEDMDEDAADALSAVFVGVEEVSK